MYHPCYPLYNKKKLVVKERKEDIVAHSQEKSNEQKPIIKY